ncbi:hypothetical protein BLNAU_18934 [Blattamonas nauphoetae]|uniref:Right handed beta helix domain-containing protein n=1 Tax=Blattamonas nauphoetae TaxID=2049346 RepID=A0ABQ9X2Z3_9EUKA|nr:hypothetical protein BLNAU_18934 [Blattamonas nauphoetae]
MTVTANYNVGGAIRVVYSSSNGHPVEISQSSFTQCKAAELDGGMAGGLRVSNSSQTTLDSCFFETCSAQSAGGVYLSFSPITLSNCAFVSCSVSDEAGALYLLFLASIEMSFVQFRECVCSIRPSSKDIFFYFVFSDIANSDTIKFCDSTSGSPNLLFINTLTEDSTLIPQLREEEKTDISSFEVSMREDTATITIGTTKEVKGTMGVLLEGSNVPRLLYVSFGTADTGSSTGTIEVSIGLEGVLPILSDEKSYTVRTASIPGWSVNANIPLCPRILSASFAFTNALLTSCSVLFVGSDLPVGKDFRVTLSPSLSFVIKVVDAEHAESSRVRIGWSDSLQFSRNYTVSSIVGLVEDENEILFDPSLSFETEAGPDEIHIFVDSSSGSSEWFCGVKSHPCSTIEAAWSIVDGVGVSKTTLDIVHNTTQSKPIVISKGMEIGVKSGETTKPELFVSAQPTLEEDGMISITESSLWMNHVDVVLTSSPSQIFVVVVNGTLTLESSSFVGSSLSSSPTLNSELFSCSWKSGAFVLKNSTTKLISSSFSLLSSGAVWIEGGSLTVEGGIFHDNSPRDPLFPSARRNIACSSGGTMMIGSLSGGDGTLDDKSAWISQNDCSLDGKDSLLDAPFFVPTLSSSESSSEFSKQNKTFSMWIVGSTLIPCENMKWWLPLAISLCVLFLLSIIVVYVCWRRRGQAQKTKSSKPGAEPQEMEIEKVEDFDAPIPNTVNVSSARELNGNTRLELEQGQKPSSGECKEATKEMIPEKDRVEGLCVKEGKFETVVVNKTHTLYERLHVEDFLALNPSPNQELRGKQTRLNIGSLLHQRIRFKFHRDRSNVFQIYCK